MTELTKDDIKNLLERFYKAGHVRGVFIDKDDREFKQICEWSNFEEFYDYIANEES